MPAIQSSCFEWWSSFVVSWMLARESRVSPRMGTEPDRSLKCYSPFAAIRAIRVSRIPHSAFRTPHSPRAFTLIEMILVMALLAIVVSVSLPTLKNFFKGRDLDSEARRFLSLTHYAASRAVSEGMPMDLYVDTQQRLYGLRIRTGYVESDSKAVEYKLPEELSFEVQAPPTTKASGEDNQAEAPDATPSDILAQNGPVKLLRFTPDGYISDRSPASVLLRQRAAPGTAQEDVVAITLSATRLNYEIRTVQPH
jgi:prepilin-type N-terminal cleavage/methylation domain-containing protein